ncbi:hypothetical protein LA303_07855 [Candidatus Sulfidibacterium hydrothermale]|uniref:hypothetical protein n=1 Tax=Candidatus Sulfidibacterium hydrothermale TaxID=2875962 RepID=UPI001F0B1E70|nr:hypothetical protein [Candidatus Sulfidibacterium hydrothermale]UBM61337.1 hypothetical protein LA303_07855 [Candidatus Sulfidibacterium hydrothermale]
MWNNEQKDIWKDIKDTWNEQPQSEKINIQVSKLIEEFKSKISQFEKDSINKDLAFITTSVTQFEKESIKRDLNLISTLLKKVTSKLNKKK